MSHPVIANYLPNCVCSRGVICPIHGPRARGRTFRNAARAVQRGVITKSAFDRWKARHTRETKNTSFNAFGS